MNDFHIKLSFRKKLLLSFIVLSFIPVLLIGITTYRLYNRFITDMTEKSSVETIDLICNDIDSLLNDTWQLCDALTRDIKIQENLRVKFNSVSSQYSLDLSGIMDMASLSALSGLSSYHMMRLFKQETGYTVGNYITEKRLIKARDLLSQGTCATQACYLSGFQNYSTFLRAYKKRYPGRPKDILNSI